MLVVFLFEISTFVKKKSVTKVYHKNRIGIYTHFRSFVPETYITGLLRSLLIQCSSLSSDFVKFRQKNSCTREFFEKCFKEFPDRTLLPKVVVTLPKNDLMITLLYFGKLSLQIRNKIWKNKLCYCNLGVVFQIRCKLSIFFFTFKNKILLFSCSTIVFKFQCGDSNATYYFKVRLCEPLRNATLTGKRVKGDVPFIWFGLFFNNG